MRRANGYCSSDVEGPLFEQVYFRCGSRVGFGVLEIPMLAGLLPST